MHDGGWIYTCLSDGIHDTRREVMRSRGCFGQADRICGRIEIDEIRERAPMSVAIREPVLLIFGFLDLGEIELMRLAGRYDSLWTPARAFGRSNTPRATKSRLAGRSASRRIR